MSTQRDSAAGDGNNEGIGDPLCESLTRAQAEAAKEAQRLKEEADEFEAESERKRAAARKLVEEADELNEKSRKKKEEAKAAEDLSASMHFEATLRRLKLNDSSLVRVDTQKYPKGYGKDLSAALLGNTVVEKLELAFDTFLSDGQEETEFEPIIKFLKTSPSLKKLENKRLENLVWNLHVPPIAFCNLLREVRSLRKLFVGFKGAPNFSDADKQMLASVFGDNKSLERLELLSPHHADFISRILANLHQLQSLRELVFWASGQTAQQHPFDAMSNYLKTAESLRRLELRRFELGDSCMERILSGLVQLASSAGLPSTSLSKLAFPKCTLDNDATGRLAAFLQTRTTDDDRLNILYRCSLDHLHLDAFSDERSYNMLADSLLMASAPSADVCKKSKVPQFLPTVGSQITFLSMAGVQPMFLDRLRRNPHRVRVKSLQLFRVSKRASIALCKCLRQLVSLESLSVEDAENGSTPWIVRGLKHNGSVCDFEIDEHDIDATQWRLVDAYCDRNANLEPLIATELSSSDGSDDGGASDAGINTTLGLRASLLQVAFAIPKKRSAMFVTGLLKLGQQCGYNQNHN